MAPLDLVLAIFKAGPPTASSVDIITSVLPDIFVFGHLFPMIYDSDDEPFFEKARHLWALWRAEPRGDQTAKVFATVADKLRVLLGDIRVRPT